MAPEPDSALMCLDVGDLELARLSDAEFAGVAKALGHPVRIQILQSFRLRCPRSVGEIASALPLAQSTVSEHLRILREARLVHTLRSGQTWHCLNRSMLRAFIERAEELRAR